MQSVIEHTHPLTTGDGVQLRPVLLHPVHASNRQTSFRDKREKTIADALCF